MAEQDPIIVDVEGYGEMEFPPDMSDAEIDDAIRKLPPRRTSDDTARTARELERLRAEHARIRGGAETPTDPGTVALRGVGGLLKNFNVLPLLRSVGETVMEGGASPSGIAGAALRRGVEAGRQILPQHLDLMRRAREDFGRGRYSEAFGRGAASLIPIAGPAIAGAADRIATGDPSEMAEGIGEAAGMMIAGPVARNVGRVGTAAAERAAGAVLGTPDANVAATALRTRTMPGVVRSGASRTAARTREAVAKADEAIASSGVGGDPVGSIARGSRDRAWNEIYGTSRSKTDANAARPVAEAFDQFARGGPSVSATMRRSEADRLGGLGGLSAADAMQRAAAADARAAVGRAVPDASMPLELIDELDPVAQAHARRNIVISHEGIPTQRARIGASVINRLFGPSAQGLHDVSRLSPAAIRSAVLLNLLEGNEPGALAPMASH